MSDDIDADTCVGCGSSLADREKRAHEGRALGALSTALRRCPHCGNEKCLMCDMGDDVECVSCHDNDGADDGF